MRSTSAPLEAYAGTRNAVQRDDVRRCASRERRIELDDARPEQRRGFDLEVRIGGVELDWPRICCTAQTSALFGSMVVTSAGYLLAHSLKKRHSSSVVGSAADTAAGAAASTSAIVNARPRQILVVPI